MHVYYLVSCQLKLFPGGSGMSRMNVRNQDAFLVYFIKQQIIRVLIEAVNGVTLSS